MGPGEVVDLKAAAAAALQGSSQFSPAMQSLVVGEVRGHSQRHVSMPFTLLHNFVIFNFWLQCHLPVWLDVLPGNS